MLALQLLTALSGLVVAVIFGSSTTTIAPQWAEVELRFESQTQYDNPYTDAEAWVDFVHESGLMIRRPVFWDGGGSFAVRFASPLAEGGWTWKSTSRARDLGLHGMTGGVGILSRDVPRPYRVYDPRTGQILLEGRLDKRSNAQARVDSGSGPRVLVFADF